MVDFQLNNFSYDPVVALGFVAFVFLLLALPISFWSVAGGSDLSKSRFLVAVSNLFLTSQLLLRWWQSGHFPISNLYESLCFLTWGCTLTQLFVERAWRSPIVSAVATPISLLSICFPVVFYFIIEATWIKHEEEKLSEKFFENINILFYLFFWIISQYHCCRES